jgi:hypothetical protein
MDKKIMEYIKTHYKDIYFTILCYQLFLCIITFSQINFKIFIALLFFLSAFILIGSWKSRSKND